MKRILSFLWLVLFIASCSSAPEYATRTDKLLAELNNPESDYVMVISHRGDWRNYPENSIPAIESVIRMGGDMVEIDLKLTKDSVLVLCHDKKIDRTLNGKGYVSDFTLDSLKTMRARRANHALTDTITIATLDEALAVCKDRILVNLDHAWNYYDEAMKVVDKYDMADQVLMKGKRPHKEVEEKMASHETNMMYMPIIDAHRESGQKLLAEYRELGFDSQIAYEICWGKYDDTIKSCMDEIVAGGSRVWVNTLWSSLCGGLDDDNAYEKGADEIYGQILDMGATMIQTERPEFLISYLRSKGLHD